MSYRDIGVILNMAVEEKSEGIKQQDDNNDAGENKEEQEQQHLSLSAKAYKLFSERKIPLEVAIALNLRELEATISTKNIESKQLHNLNIVYEETKGDIAPFLKLYRLSKVKRMGVKQVIDILAVANKRFTSI